MPLDDEILQRLRDNDITLTSLDLSDSQIGDAKVLTLAMELEKNSTLTSLDLCDNQIGDTGAQALATVLEKNTALTWLRLSYNQISAAGAKALGKCITKNTTLEELCLEDNKINDAGAKALGKRIAKNTTLRSMNLGNNQISDVGALVLGKAIARNATLTSLFILDGNQISNKVASEIHGLLIKRNWQCLRDLEKAACKQLIVGRVLLYKPEVAKPGNSITILPLEICEKIAKHAGENQLITEEQQRLILNYAEGKVTPVADKYSFFKVTKCDKVMKQHNQYKVEAVEQELAQLEV